MRYLLVAIFMTDLISSPLKAFCSKDEKGNDVNTSLLKVGENLEGYRAYDQNGYGTCYANSLSTSLYSLTGKEISYHQIAIATQTNKKTQSLGNEENVLAGANDPCSGLKALKKEKIICNRDSAPIEMLSDDKNARLAHHNLLVEIYNSKILDDIPADKKEEIKQMVELQQSDGPSLMSKMKCAKKIHDYFRGDKPASLTKRKHKTVESAIEFHAIDAFNDLAGNFSADIRREFKSEELKEYMKDIDNFEILFRLLNSPIILKDSEDNEIRVTNKDEMLDQLINNSNIQLRTPADLNKNFVKSIYRHLAEEYNSFYRSKSYTDLFLTIKKDKSLNKNTSLRSKEASIDGFLKKIGNDESLKIEGHEDMGFPGNIFLNFREANLKNSIHSVIPGECEKAYIMKNSSGIECDPESISSTYKSINKLLNMIQQTKTKIGEIDGGNSDTLFSPKMIDSLFSAKDKSLKEYLLAFSNPDCNLQQNQIDKNTITDIKCEAEFINNKKKLIAFGHKLPEEEKKQMIRDLDPSLLQNLQRPDGKFNHKEFNSLISKYIGSQNTKNYLIKKKLDREIFNSIEGNRNNNRGSLVALMCSEVIHSKTPGKECTPHLVNFVGIRCKKGKQEYHVIDSYGQQGGVWIEEGKLFGGDNINKIFKTSKK